MRVVLLFSNVCVHTGYVKCVTMPQKGSLPVMSTQVSLPRLCKIADFILIGIQSALQADCIAGMASAARSRGIPSPDPDSCYTALLH